MLDNLHNSTRKLPGENAYFEATLSPHRLEYSKLLKGWLGESKDFYDPQGWLVESFNLPLVCVIFQDSDGRILQYDFRPILNHSKDISQYIAEIVYANGVDTESLGSNSNVPFTIHHTLRTFTIFPYFIKTEGVSEFPSLKNKDPLHLLQLFSNESVMHNASARKLQSFVYQDGNYLQVKANEKFDPSAKKVFLPKNDFTTALELVSYMCVDAVPLITIDGKTYVGCAKRVNNPGVVYPHEFFFGGRIDKNMTPQLASAHHINEDIFGGAFTEQAIHDVATNLNFLSANQTSFHNQDDGYPKSTTNITLTIDLTEYVETLATTQLRAAEYEGSIKWISIEDIVDRMKHGNIITHPPYYTLKADGLYFGGMKELHTGYFQPGASLWGKLQDVAQAFLTEKKDETIVKSTRLC